MAGGSLSLRMPNRCSNTVKLSNNSQALSFSSVTVRALSSVIAVLYQECLKMNSKLLCKLEKSSSVLNSLEFSAGLFISDTGMSQNLGEYTNWIFS